MTAGIAWLDGGLLASALVTSTVILVLTTLCAIEIVYETIENGATDYKSLGQSAFLAVAMAGFIAVFGRWELAAFAVAAGAIISVRLLYHILVR